MSPFPPSRLATRGAYALVSDPIYVGAALLSAGAAMALGSPAGIWIVTPVFAASMAAFVLGYEREATTVRFGAAPRPWLRLPDRTEANPTLPERLSVYVLVLLPWLIAYQAVEFLGVPRDAISTVPAVRSALACRAVDRGNLPAVLPARRCSTGCRAPSRRSAALCARRSWRRRRASSRSTCSSRWSRRPSPFRPAACGQRFSRGSERATRRSRRFLPSTSSGPASRGEVFARRWPRARLAVAATVAAVAVSCVTTGMHAVLDVCAGFAAWGLLRESRPHLGSPLCGHRDGGQFMGRADDWQSALPHARHLRGRRRGTRRGPRGGHGWARCRLVADWARADRASGRRGLGAGRGRFLAVAAAVRILRLRRRGGRGRADGLGCRRRPLAAARRLRGWRVRHASLRPRALPDPGMLPRTAGGRAVGHPLPSPALAGAAPEPARWRAPSSDAPLLDSRVAGDVRGPRAAVDACRAAAVHRRPLLDPHRARALRRRALPRRAADGLRRGAAACTSGSRLRSW